MFEGSPGSPGAESGMHRFLLFLLLFVYASTQVVVRRSFCLRVRLGALRGPSFLGIRQGFVLVFFVYAPSIIWLCQVRGPGGFVLASDGAPDAEPRHARNLRTSSCTRK